VVAADRSPQGAAVLHHARDGGVLTLTLARPDRGNALGPELVEALLLAVRSAPAETSLHTLVFRGEGRHFCTGLDLSDLAQSTDADWLWRLVRIETLLDAVWRSPLRTVALAQGRAWGAGADLFAACECRVAAPDTSLRFPGAQFGIVLGTRRLAERVGPARARRLVVDGGSLDAEAARAAGLATDLGTSCDTPAPQVDATTAHALRAATRADAPDEDLAALVRSASEPGLQQRIQAYRDRTTAARRND
jgi:enoyl-CoA hydratase